MEIYRHRKDLWNLRFWKCDHCSNHVGCHRRPSGLARPLGCIPNREMREARKCIHEKLDPLWQSGRIKRGKLYKQISKALGYEYHTGELRSMHEARMVWRIIAQIEKSLA